MSFINYIFQFGRRQKGKKTVLRVTVTCVVRLGDPQRRGLGRGGNVVALAAGGQASPGRRPAGPQ